MGGHVGAQVSLSFITYLVCCPTVGTVAASSSSRWLSGDTSPEAAPGPGG